MAKFVMVPPPAGGFSSNRNYFLVDGGNSLLNASVVVNFDTDFISIANGWSIQLNAYSNSGAATGWQQYVVYASPGSNQLVARIDNWDSTLVELIRTDDNLAILPSATIPAGYIISIFLLNDAGGNVTGASFAVFDNTSKSLGQVVTSILGQTLRTTGQPAVQSNLAPIVTFQLNIVGDYGGAAATLSSGSGRITYTAQRTKANLSVVNSAPSNIDDPTTITAETANLTYGVIPNSATPQTFSAILAGTTAIRVEERRLYPGVREHALPPPEAEQ